MSAARPATAKVGRRRATPISSRGLFARAKADFRRRLSAGASLLPGLLKFVNMKSRRPPAARRAGSSSSSCLILLSSDAARALGVCCCCRPLLVDDLPRRGSSADDVTRPSVPPLPRGEKAPPLLELPLSLEKSSALECVFTWSRALSGIAGSNSHSYILAVMPCAVGSRVSTLLSARVGHRLRFARAILDRRDETFGDRSQGRRLDTRADHSDISPSTTPLYITLFLPRTR